MFSPFLIVMLLCAFNTVQGFSFGMRRFTHVRRKPLQFEIVSSAVVGFLPWLELHHIVVIRDPKKANGVYTLDFSPVNQQNWKTLGKLLLGQNVEGVVRVKWIPDEILSINEIKHKCMCWDIGLIENLRKIETTDSDVDSTTIERFVVKMKKEWREYMNLYYHNCRHFSRFVFRKAMEEFEIN